MVFKYLLVCMLTVIVGMGLGMGCWLVFNRFGLAGSSLINNRLGLREYLGVAEFSSGPLEYRAETSGGLTISSLKVVPHDFWMVTSNCIAESIGGERIFCVEELVEKDKLIINVYPNLKQIGLTKPETVDRLLNMVIISVLEPAFGLETKLKNAILDKGSRGFVFKW